MTDFKNAERQPSFFWRVVGLRRTITQQAIKRAQNDC